MPAEDTAKTENWSIGRLLNWTREYFGRKGLDEPRLAAEVLLAKALACRRIELYARFEQTPAPAQVDAFRSYVKQAAENVPIAYIVGSKEFFSLEFEVGPAVLVPRPETELLVERVIDFIRRRPVPDGPVDIFELGTGSGCIAVALLKYLPSAHVVASDISGAALSIAGRNADRHGVANRARLVESDRFQLPADSVPPTGFDVIVSNPPYVAADEMAKLPPAVRQHEPTVALTDGADGLSYYREIAAAGPAILKAEGAIFVEIADGRGAAVREIYGSHGWEHVGTWRDTTTGNERVMGFRRRPVG